MSWYYGLGAQDFFLFVARFVLGFFFVSYRFRFVWDPMGSPRFWNVGRHEKLQQKLCHCGWGANPTFAIFIAISELLAGVGVIFGLLTIPSALGLLLILLGATYCTAREKTLKQDPIDTVDCINCYFWNPEPVYIVVTLMVLSFGPGAISLDHLLRIMFT